MYTLLQGTQGVTQPLNRTLIMHNVRLSGKSIAYSVERTFLLVSVLKAGDWKIGKLCASALRRTPTRFRGLVGELWENEERNFYVFPRLLSVWPYWRKRMTKNLGQRFGNKVYLMKMVCFPYKSRCYSAPLQRRRRLLSFEIVEHWFSTRAVLLLLYVYKALYDSAPS